MKSIVTFRYGILFTTPLIVFLLFLVTPLRAEIGIPTDAQVIFAVHADYSDRLAPSTANLEVKIYEITRNRKKLVESLSGKKVAYSAKDTFFSLRSKNWIPLLRGSVDFLVVALGRLTMKKGPDAYCFQLSGKQIEKVNVKVGLNIIPIKMYLDDRSIQCPMPLL